MSTFNKVTIAGIIILVILLVGLYTYYSLPPVQTSLARIESNAIGLDRTITLYAYDGKPIKSWKGRVQVELNGGTARFAIDHKAIIISGTYSIEEN